MAQRIRSAKWINKIPGVKSVDSGRLTVALAESVVFRNLMRCVKVRKSESALFGFIVADDVKTLDVLVRNGGLMMSP